MNPSVTHAGHGEGVATFASLWSPGILLALIVVGVLYTYAVGPWRERFEGSEPVTTKQRLYFWTGLALWYIADGSPLSFYGDYYFFSFHMFQQSILYLVMPPFLILGIPDWLIRAAIRGEKAKFIMRWLSNPLLALFMFNFIFSMYHVPVMMEALMAQPVLLALYRAVFLFAAFQMWFPVFCPLPEYTQMSDLKKLAYIFVNGILLTPACALIIFAREPLYAMYASVPPEYLMLPMLDDQQLGGVVMKIVQEIAYGVALAYVFFRWYRMERKKDEEEEAQEAYYPMSTGANRV